MKYFITLFFSIVICIYTFGQSGNGFVRGRLFDSLGKQPLAGASIVLSARDSIFGKTFSNGEGLFELKGVPLNRSFQLTISYKGYSFYTRSLHLRDTKYLDLGLIYLQKEVHTLDTVYVRSRIAEVMIKKDTIEFNALAFNSRTSDVVEDLLKKMPGLEVDPSGIVTFNGKVVSKILVDGKEYFGGDPLLITRNLSALRVSKIQVVDSKSLEQSFNGLTGDGEFKTINIKLKKEENNISGKVYGGAGTDKRLDAGTMINMKHNASQIDLLGSVNNVNKIGFGDNGGTGNGITATTIAGLNFSNPSADKLKVSSSYLYDNVRSDNASFVDRKQIVLADSSLNYKSRKTQTGNGFGHRLQANMEYDPDSSITLNIFPAFNERKLSSTLVSTTETSDNKGNLVNQSVMNNDEHENSTNYSLQSFFGKRVNDRGRAFTLSFFASKTQQRSNATNQSQNIYYSFNALDSSVSTNQQVVSVNNSASYGLGASFSEPLSAKLKLIIHNDFDINTSTLDKKSFRVDSLRNIFVDSAFSGYFTSSTSENLANISVFYNPDQWELSFGVSSFYSEISNQYNSGKYSVKIRQFNITPEMGVSYHFSKDKIIRLDYSASTVQPGPDQLLQIPDNTNPLFVKSGNPNLKTSLFHNISFSYSGFNQKNGFSAGLQYYLYRNKIINAITYDRYGRQNQTYMNVNGPFNIGGSFGYSRNLACAKCSNVLSFGFSGNFNRDLSSTNDSLTTVNTLSVSPVLSLRTNYNSVLYINIHYAFLYTDARYVGSSNAGVSFISQILRAELKIYFWKKLCLSTDVSSSTNNNMANLKANSFLWNAYVSHNFLKDGKAMIKLYVYDILKKNVNFQRLTTSTYVQDVQSQVLKQYAMLSFYYHFHSSKPD